ncbi:MAG TPA: pilus assembly protein [Syntrophomonadaceae bacterium]|nr:pilus assembly protein [Syntrophomonadaceae bacterium]
MLEFALVLPILLLLVFGIIEFGIIFFDNLVITQAAREGARVGVVGGSDAEILDTVERIAGTLDVSRLQIEIDPDQSGRSRGDSLKVKVHYDVPILTPIMGQFIPNPYPLEAAAIMRVE